MEFQSYQSQITQKGYTVNNGIFVDKQGKPKCFNPVFEDLLDRLHNGFPLTYREQELFGQLFVSLVKIVLNHFRFKKQEHEVKQECEDEAYSEAYPLVIKYFKKGKGTAYSFAFRVIYTQMIHVLERKNKRQEFLTNLIERYEDDRIDCGHKVETPVYN